MRWKRQSITERRATTDEVAKLGMIQGHNLVAVGDTLYVDGGHVFAGDLQGHSEPQIFDLEQNQTAWKQNQLLYAFDMSRPMEDSTTAEFLTPYCSIVSKSPPATNGWGGYAHPNPLNEKSFIHIGGQVDNDTGSGPEVPFWGFSKFAGFRNDFEINDKRKTGDLFNVYDGASAVSPDGKVYLLGGVRSNGGAPKGGARLAMYDLKTGEVDSWPANGGNLSIPPGANLRGSSMVWLPYGEQGILVNIGGFIYMGGQSVANSMDKIMVFDIAGKRWYTQGATAGNPSDGTPSGRSHFCAVTPSPQPNRTSYEIIFYCGFNPNGDNDNKAFDDVWALTVPTFQWANYYSFPGGPFGKYNRSCALINDYWYTMVDYAISDGVAILTFWDITLGASSDDLRNGGWGRYDPSLRGYKTPLKILSLNQGRDAPTAGWAPGLSSIFAQDIYTGTPATVTSTSNSNSATSATHPSKAGPIVGGVLGGITGMAVICILFFLLRLRRRVSPPPTPIPPYEMPADDIKPFELEARETTPISDSSSSPHVAPSGEISGQRGGTPTSPDEVASPLSPDEGNGAHIAHSQEVSPLSPSPASVTEINK